MSRPPGYRRLTRKARHLITQLRHTKHASVQSAAMHELVHEVDRRHGKRTMGNRQDHGAAGQWRPLTHRAKQLLTRLRRAKVWKVQKQLVRELRAEIEKGRRRIDRIRQSKAVAKARAAARKTGRSIVRGAKAAGRGMRAGGKSARAASRRAQEPMIRRGEARAAAVRDDKAASRSKEPAPAARTQPARTEPPHGRAPLALPAARTARPASRTRD